MYLNPIDVFVLFKEKIRDWNEIQSVLHNDSSTRFIQAIEDTRERAYWYPTEGDLTAAAQSFFRLQDTYEMTPADFANGQLKHLRSKTTLGVNDLTFIGRVAQNRNDSYHAVSWLELATAKIELQEEDSNVDSDQLLSTFAEALRQQGNPERADVLQKRCQNASASPDKLLENWEMLTFEKVPPLKNVRSFNTEIEEQFVFEQHCRGEIKLVSVRVEIWIFFSKPDVVAKLYCYYKRDRPELLIAPFKVEIVHLSPLVVLFIDVIGDAEIEAIKEISVYHLIRSSVYDKSRQILSSTNRLSKNQPFLATESEDLERVNKRIELMTNLDTDGEQLVPANYGVGGLFAPHVDYQRDGVPRTPEDVGKGDRLATIIFYPDFGGSTVFHGIGLEVKATKYDAIFWYNLYQNGEGDIRTRHASCPILSGEKWTTLQFIHEYQQTFRRPCGLEENENENFIGDLGDKTTPRHSPNF